MAVLPILHWPDVRLREIAGPVTRNRDNRRLIKDLYDTMYAALGRGLAAPQVGAMKRLFVMDITWKQAKPSPMAFVNPRIVEASEDWVQAEEACLSIPGISVIVSRPEWVVVAWTNPKGREHTRRFDGFSARCVQHELDHLNGIVTLEHLDAREREIAEAQYAARQ